MLPEFEAATLGLKVGESKTFPLPFPEDYHGKDVAGKTAEFTITLKKLEWKNSQPLGADTAGAVRKLKDGSGGDIGVHGSIRLVQWLIREGLLDELVLYVMPTVAGQGLRRLFEPGESKRVMKLARSRVAPNGIAILTYEVAKS